VGEKAIYCSQIAALLFKALERSIKRHYEKLKKLCALGKTADRSPQTLKERDAEFLAKVRKKRPDSLDQACCSNIKSW
jgi:hypothetical protein